jgi:nucleotide-binding universal stress UspA family protein
MVEIQTILCPVDFTSATERQVLFAVDLCRFFGARLVLHHNLGTLGVGSAVGWMRAADHDRPQSEKEATQRLQEILAWVPSSIPSRAQLTHGTPTSSVLTVAKLFSAELLVLTAHRGTHDEHMSMSEQLLDQSSCSVLALHETGVDRTSPRFSSGQAEPQRVLVPCSFSPSSDAAVRLAFELARRLPLEVHLLHVEPSRMHRDDPHDALAEEHRSWLQGMLPDDLREMGRVHVVAGDPAAEAADIAESLGAALIVMGEHTRAPIRRWFSRDHGRILLHRAHCPVWYVPSRMPHRAAEASAVEQAATA